MRKEMMKKMTFILMFVALFIIGCMLTKARGKTKTETICARIVGWGDVIGCVLFILYAFGSVE